MTNTTEAILRTENLKKYFPVRKGLNPLARREQRYVRAVDGVSISVQRGRTSAIVGESGCGKTTLARTIALMTPRTGGKLYFEENELIKGKVDRTQIYRNMQMVYQDPESSLDPRMKVGQSIAEPLFGLMKWEKQTVKESVERSLQLVGLSDEFADRFPRQLSGGQKQRIAIARAIAIQPSLVILDEPTSALDASVQAQILKLLLDLQNEFKLTYLMITHNIAVAKYMADFVAVMYGGNIVEYGQTRTVISKPRHPYTIALISSAPVPDPNTRNLLQTEIRGEVPSAIDPPTGCKFHPRCPFAEDICTSSNPPLEEIAPGHFVACHFVNKTA
jgi:oligopeptide/dipeptide ABC transporter ATP-binding protein